MSTQINNLAEAVKQTYSREIMDQKLKEVDDRLATLFTAQQRTDHQIAANQDEIKKAQVDSNERLWTRFAIVLTSGWTLLQLLHYLPK